MQAGASPSKSPASGAPRCSGPDNAGMGEARAHHIISQCYLKGFNSKLFVVDLQQLKTFESKPQGVAQRRDFNRIEGLPAGALENRLAKFESVADQALLKIGADRSLSDADAWTHILNLAALFAVRNPSQRENVRGFMEKVAKRIMDMSLATRERWESQVRQAAAASAMSADSSVTYEQMRDFHERGEYTIQVPNARHIDFEFNVFETVLHTLVNRKMLWRTAQARPVGLERGFPSLYARRTEMTSHSTALQGKDTAIHCVVYMSFELGDKLWKLTLSDGLHAASRCTVTAGDTAAVLDCIVKARQRGGSPVTAKVRSCYEAGRDGWWLHRWLVDQGIDNIVVDSTVDLEDLHRQLGQVSKRRVARSEVVDRNVDVKGAQLM